MEDSKSLRKRLFLYNPYNLIYFRRVVVEHEPCIPKGVVHFQSKLSAILVVSAKLIKY